MSSIQAQVLGLPELLQGILLHLPTRDLLVNAQRVCHAWKEAIETPILQQALFFESVPESAKRAPEFNPLLHEVFFPWFDPEQGEKNRFSRGDEIKALKWNRSGMKRAAIMRKEASWRRMLPVQPPATVLEIDFCSSSMGGGYHGRGEKQLADGVRMGMLYDYVQQSVSTPITSFWIEWKMSPPIVDDEMPAGNDDWISSPKVTIHVNYTHQCCAGMAPDLGPDFRSKGFEDLEIELKPVVGMPNLIDDAGGLYD